MLAFPNDLGEGRMRVLWGAGIAVLLVIIGWSMMARQGEAGHIPSYLEDAALPSAQAQSQTLGDNSFPDIPAWRPVDPENLLLIDVEAGRIAIELADWIAPHHVDRMRTAARDGFYDGRRFYRVIDGFVAQGGRGEDQTAQDLPQYPALTGEFWVAGAQVDFTPMIDADLYAPRVGHVSGFPAASTEDGSQVWPLHCPGTVAMARDTDPDSGDVEFYIVIGHGPRHLDRIMSVFGRVIDGMEHVQALNRGDPAVNSGVIADIADQDQMVSVRLAADLPADQRPAYEVMDTRSADFHARKAARRERTHEFFFETPPPVIEACHLPAPVRRL